MDSDVPASVPLYRYRFEDAEFDEVRMSLRVAGVASTLEQRPLRLLALLLRHADEVVPRATLFDTIWAGRPTVDNVLANAVAKLRKALGPQAGRRVVNVPRVGYRLQGPVERTVAGRHDPVAFSLVAGQPVPGRAHVLLHECLDPAAGGSVWRARHVKTGETSVYKFAIDASRLAALKREVTLQRVLQESLGDRADFVRLIDWNFESPPYWLQSEDAGRDLAGWATADPAFAGASTARRVQWFLQLADAVAAAHRVGVLHKDLKPANVLVAAQGEDWQLRVADFGSGSLMDSGRLDALGITGMGLTLTGDLSDHARVTLSYLAPEVLAGQPPSVRSDVYALGLILFQMIVADMRRTLAPGWEREVEDELLREDIAAATSGDPERRLPDADALVQRLRSREARAIERRRLRDSDARALAAEHALERARGRRPWLITAVALLVLGLGASLWQLQQLRAARADTQRQAAAAAAANRFLNEDLLGAGVGGSSPAWYERNPSLREILDAAAGKIDQRFADEPLLRATLHQTLGRAYRSTGGYTQAAVQLEAASSGLARVLGAADDRSVLAGYELAATLAHLSRFDEAEQLLARTDAAAGARRDAVSEIALQAQLARGDIAFQRMHVAPALAAYQRAQQLQGQLRPSDAALSAHILLSIAGCDLRMGHPKQAEAASRKILEGAPYYTQESIGLAAIATARSRLGDALRGQGLVQQAIPVMQQSLDDYQRSEGADSQGAISALSALSYLYSLSGDGAKALQLQREVWQRAVQRWGAQSQYALVELLNLGSDEYDSEDLKPALAHLQQAELGLTRVSGKHAPVTQAARVALANVYSDLGRHREALAMIREIDPAAYQATTSDPGRGAVLRAMQARVELRLHRPGAEARLRDALAAMQAAGVTDDELATFRQALAPARASSGAAGRATGS